MAEYNQIELVQQLKTVVGALPFDGDASNQVLIPLQGGGYLRVGVTDDDVDAGAIWFDRYEGLPLVARDGIQDQRFQCPECEHQF